MRFLRAVDSTTLYPVEGKTHTQKNTPTLPSIPCNDRMDVFLCPPTPRISTRYLKQLLGRVCRVAEDGKRLLFEYSQRLAPAADAKDGAGAECDGNRVAASTPPDSQSSAR